MTYSDTAVFCSYCGDCIEINESDEILTGADGYFCDRRCCDDFYDIKYV